ncbi:MAG: MarR family winged helix-turn-helix transcriptional regulator [Rhodobacteraceae bacterium]|nr:MarR family winged helix-turn-helix transcriptional regulator [Paracoccaceae bacterium]
MAGLRADGAAAKSPADVHDFYLDTLALIERLHRLLLDVIKDEFERLGEPEVNPVQALLLFNVGSQEVTAGELRSRGYYQGSNVSYNLKKLVESGHMHHERSAADRRSVRVSLTEKGHAVRRRVAELVRRHAEGMTQSGAADATSLADANAQLRRIERYWAERIRYIY